MKKFFTAFTFAGLLFLSSNSFGQIRIQILNEALEAIEGAVLSSQDLQTSVLSNSEGLIDIDGQILQAVVISHVGFKELSFQKLESGQFTFIMQPAIQQLNDVVVKGFNNDERLNTVAGSVRKLGFTELNRFDEQSLVRPINLIPGVTFEERAASSYRVSIRGSSLRSPFGVRNVKVYWNGIPFTDPGGNTFVNLLDRQNVSAVEVIKGPAGSLFGAGTGGVMQMQSTNYADLVNSVQLNATAGSFGLQRYAVAWNSLSQKGSITAKFTHHSADGYRRHNKSNKNVFELDGLLFANDHNTVEMSLLYSDLKYQIPGGLTAEQVAEDPRQPRAGSVERKASIDHQMLLMKIGNTYQVSSSFSNNTQFFGSFRRFENPFILDYKRDTEQRLGLRSFNDHRFGQDGQVKLTYGLEYQQAFFDGKNFGNRAGQSDTIRFADELNSQELIAFTTLQYKWKKWQAELGLSYGQTIYDINRTIDKITDNPRSFKKTFDPVLNPRIAISRSIHPWLSAHISVSSGYSVPTTSEVRTNEGSLNTDLQAERGVNYELNLRGGKGKFSYDLALFHFDLSESITTYTNPDGVVLFRNSGNITQNGLELEFRQNWLEAGTGLFKDVSTTLAYTNHDFQFGDYENRGNNLKGNALTGTAPNVLGFTTDLLTGGGIFFNLSYLYTDEIPLNDANTVFSNAFHLVDLKFGYAKNFGKTQAQLSIGVDNLLDESYSLGNDLNAFGGRYFQPAPTRNFFVDLKLKFAR